jgi:hypothetical protein
MATTKRIRRPAPDGGFTMGRGAMGYLTGDEAIAERMRRTLRINVGEWFYNAGIYVPWYQPDDSVVQPILGGRRDDAYAAAVLKAVISKVDGVVSIEAFSLEVDTATRKMSVSVTVVTVNSTSLTVEVESP